MNIKPKPNHKIYLESLSRMSNEQKLNKVFELSYFSKNLFREGLKKIFYDLEEEQFKELFLKRISKCYNRNY
ncbi:MAG: hypothetical protein FJW56_01875 [Actinobacteria bacterium]|nr:hypothetical protein [Actinomycetota bacterium]